jgi:UDPglucose 6-dehydrogenase
MIKKGVEEGLIHATTDINEVIKSTDISFICVGTPTSDEGNIDLTYIKSVSNDIGKALKEKKAYHVVSVKSTVIPGTSDSHVIPIIEKASGKKVGIDFGVCMTPEFLQEGSSIHDFFNPEKIVIGAYDEKSKDTMYKAFKDFHPEKYGRDVFLFCDLRTAEMIKYANNSFLATKISFINEMANLSENFGVDVKIISKAIGMDKRISSHFLNSGLGFGGSCFPKDVKALLKAGELSGYKSKILPAVLDVNEIQPMRSIHILEKELGNLDGKVISILGLSFKPNTNDVRYAPSIKIIKTLLNRNSNIRAYDPVAIESFKKETGLNENHNIKYCKSPKESLENADAVIIVTEWDEFLNLKSDLFLNQMKTPVIVDGRRIFSRKMFSGTKIKYIALGFSDSKDFKP